MFGEVFHIYIPCSPSVYISFFFHTAYPGAFVYKVTKCYSIPGFGAYLGEILWGLLLFFLWFCFGGVNNPLSFGGFGILSRKQYDWTELELFCFTCFEGSPCYGGRLKIGLQMDM